MFWWKKNHYTSATARRWALMQSMTSELWWCRCSCRSASNAEPNDYYTFCTHLETDITNPFITPKDSTIQPLLKRTVSRQVQRIRTIHRYPLTLFFMRLQGLSESFSNTQNYNAQSLIKSLTSSVLIIPCILMVLPIYKTKQVFTALFAYGTYPDYYSPRRLQTWIMVRWCNQYSGTH